MSVTALATMLTVALYLWRSRNAILHPQLIAEDGAVFFTEAKLYGLASLRLDYAGYLHLLPRIVAWVGSFRPSPQAPALYLSGATIVVAWAAASMASAERPYAWALAPLAMMVPVGGEVFGTLTNVQWLTQAALALIVITSTPRSKGSRWNQLVFALATSLTGPFSIFVAPLVIWRALSDRADRHAWALCAVILLGALVQLSLVLPQPSPYEGDGIRDALHLAVAMLDRWIGEAAHAGRTADAADGLRTMLLTIAVGAAAWSSRGLGARLFAYAAIVLVATFVRLMPNSHVFDGADFFDRYFYMPRLALLWILAAEALRLRRTSITAALGMALMLSGNKPWERPPDPRLPWAEEAAEIDQGLAVRIVINPSRLGEIPPAWAVTLPGRP